MVKDCVCVCLVSQSCLTLCDAMDYSLPGSSVHAILQARILEWVAISSSRGSSQHRDETHVSVNTTFAFNKLKTAPIRQLHWI